MTFALVYQFPVLYEVWKDACVAVSLLWTVSPCKELDAVLHSSKTATDLSDSCRLHY